ncbi:MAG: Asp-tRNA(Asn)/Glu-tRNA(Gln) amidotransferase subunit GatC [Candidatus Eutrophobiaceae bacterium]
MRQNRVPLHSLEFPSKTVKISEEEVARIAGIARIKLADAEHGAIARDLSRIFMLFNELAEIDASGIAPLAHPLGIAAPFREDRVTEDTQRELLQQNAPETDEHYYLVPRVIE